MPRKPRMYLPGIPCHVIQRGNNREACFYTEDDYFFYLERLGSAAKRHRVDIHAYVLMTNHVHLLATESRGYFQGHAVSGASICPIHQLDLSAQRDALGGAAQSQSGPAADYLFISYRYIKLNPRARKVEHPADFRWSSYRANASGSENDLITPHELYRRLAPTPDERQRAYREMFRLTH